jgi:glycosyltransferase involved in cell wall biosynthesis
LVNGLISAGHEVILASLSGSERDGQYKQVLEEKGIRVIDVSLSRLAKVFNALQSLVHGEPLQYRLLYSKRLQALLDQLLQTEPIDVIHVEHLRMTHYAREWLGRFPVVWDAVDHIAPLFRQAQTLSTSRAWRWVSLLEAPRLERFEVQLSRQFPVIVVISSRDKKTFSEAGADPNRITVIPIGRTLPTLLNAPRDPQTLIFTGNMNYHPNVAAVLYFVRSIFPLILAQYPQVQLQLVGAHPTDEILALRSSNIEVTGFVDDLNVYLQRATIALAPITYATGAQNKVIEALMNATPIVATSQAMENLNLEVGKHILVGDTPQAFAEVVCDLLANADWRERFGQAGRAFVHEHYSTDKVIEQLVECYQQAITQHASSD